MDRLALLRQARDMKLTLQPHGEPSVDIIMRRDGKYDERMCHKHGSGACSNGVRCERSP